MKLYNTYLGELKTKLDWGDHNTESESNPGPTTKEIDDARNNVRNAYNQYIIELVAAQEEDLRRKGVIE